MTKILFLSIVTVVILAIGIVGFWTIGKVIQTRGPILTITVIDAITKQPIHDASVTLKRAITCPPDGRPCPDESFAKKKTNVTGQASFDHRFLQEIQTSSVYSLRVETTAEGYNDNEKTFPIGTIEKSFTIELIGGNLAVKTWGEAVERVRRESQWVKDHPNSKELLSPFFESPYWIVRFNDKTTCRYESKKGQSVDCGIEVAVDARDGSMTEKMSGGKE